VTADRPVATSRPARLVVPLASAIGIAFGAVLYGFSVLITTEAAGRYTPQHPAYRTLQSQIGQFQSERNALMGRIGQLPDVQQGLFRLSRDVEVTNQTYANLLDQAQQLNIARASAIGNARIIDPADANLANPAWPKPLPILAGSVALGAMRCRARCWTSRRISWSEHFGRTSFRIFTCPARHSSICGPAG
jgi:hypothetical protein